MSAPLLIKLNAQVCTDNTLIYVQSRCCHGLVGARLWRHYRLIAILIVPTYS